MNLLILICLIHKLTIGIKMELRYKEISADKSLSRSISYPGSAISLLIFVYFTEQDPGRTEVDFLISFNIYRILYLPMTVLYLSLIRVRPRVDVFLSNIVKHHR